MLKYFHGQRHYLSLFSLAQWEDTLICCYPTTLPAAQLGGLRDVCVPFVYPQPAAVSSDYITDTHIFFLWFMILSTHRELPKSHQSEFAVPLYKILQEHLSFYTERVTFSPLGQNFLLPVPTAVDHISSKCSTDELSIVQNITALKFKYILKRSVTWLHTPPKNIPFLIFH